MASPPYNHNYGASASPPYPSPAALPQSRKRTSDMPTNAPTVKRRKGSIMSTDSRLSVHPLRQTSFPPDGNDIGSRRSPSLDTASLVSGSVAAGGTGKKRGRKPKNRVDDDASLVGGKALTAASGASGRGRKREQSLEEEDDDEGDDMNVTTVARTAEDKEEEKQHRAMLVAAFDDEQFRRYEVWRSSRLSDSIVRRLVNQTLSQSVPASVILAVKSVSKLYAGEIIERARKVQTQWLELSGEDQTTGLPSPPASEGEEKKKKEIRRGPLTPDHLREALRRIKLECAGGPGLLGIGRLEHATGVERFGLKTKGKRLFK